MQNVDFKLGILPFKKEIFLYKVFHNRIKF